MINLRLKIMAIERQTLKRMMMKMRQILSFVMEIKEGSVNLDLATSAPSLLSNLTFFLIKKLVWPKLSENPQSL